MNAETRFEMFERLLKKIPNPTTELNYSTPFELLVAVTLSAQATDKSVNKVTDKLFPIANTPESIFELGEDTLRNTIKTIGLFNSKAKHIIQACKILIEKYDSNVPETRKELEALPGVGRKTANVFLAENGESNIGVDTHVSYISQYLGWVKTDKPELIENELKKLFPKEIWGKLNRILVRFGKTYTSRVQKNMWLDYIKKNVK